MQPVEFVRSVKNLFIPKPASLTKEVIKEAKQEWVEFRSGFGFNTDSSLSGIVFGTMPTDNKKYGKGDELIYGLSLAQSRISGINVCLWSSPECRNNCVGKNGNGMYPATIRSRIAKTRFLFSNPEEAGILLADFFKKADDKGIQVRRKTHRPYMIGGRLNTFSDIDWTVSAPWIFEMFPKIRFYDYTKCWDRVSQFENYHLTYSASERTTDEQITQFVGSGKNVAVVFDMWAPKPLPEEFLGFQVVDGDATDSRWKDPEGVIVGLRRKGSMRADSPMVRRG